MKVRWFDNAQHADIVEQIDAKVNEACKLMAEDLIRKAREMEPIPAFSYCRPELHKPRRKSRLMRRVMKETREQIRAQFGLPGDRS